MAHQQKSPLSFVVIVVDVVLFGVRFYAKIEKELCTVVEKRQRATSSSPNIEKQLNWLLGKHVEIVLRAIKAKESEKVMQTLCHSTLHELKKLIE